jgi:hypothetical protein
MRRPVEEGAELPLDEWRHGPVPLLLLGKEGFHTGDDLIQHRCFRVAWSIIEGGLRHALADRHASGQALALAL